MLAKKQQVIEKMVTEEQTREAYVNLAAACTQELVKAFRQDMFPDDETEKMFGIVMNDSANDGLGDLIFRAWVEIYKRRLFHGGENVYGQAGLASRQFEADLTQAITSNNLAPSFRRWVKEVVDDERFPMGAYCIELESRNLTMDFVIHPTNPEHRQWMERFRTELGAVQPATRAASSPSPSGSAPHSPPSNFFCQWCGGYGARSRCASCKEVYYCSKDHQKKDWSRHKACCKAVAAEPTSVWIEVQEGEGNGLANIMTNHIFANKAQGLDFVREHLGSVSPPLRSPFCELTGWNIEIYCRPDYNDVSQAGRVIGRVRGHLNAAGIYLGSDLYDGLTRYNNMSGRIFVTGRFHKDGKPLNNDNLWGLLNFIWDAMDLYDGTLDEPIQPTLQHWSTQYKQGSWVPRGGSGGIDIYSNDFSKGARDHQNREDLELLD